MGFAEFLARSESGDCHLRLADAQSQLEAARQSQAEIALPFALAREAAVEYQIHVGRAYCDSDADSRDRELRAAAMYMRLVIDPKTLLLYESDTRRLSYWMIKGTGYHQPVIESERTHEASELIARTE